MPDRSAPLVAQPFHLIHLADQAAVNRIHRAHLERPASVLRPDLQHAFRLARHLQHLLAFLDVVAGRLLAIDVLARLHRPDRRQRVPVIRRRDRYRFDRRIRERLAHVLELFRLLAGILQQRGIGLLARRLIDIANPGYARLGHLRINGEVVRTAASKADDADVHLIVRAPNARRCRGSGRA
jgi:hypothetical protein